MSTPTKAREPSHRDAGDAKHAEPIPLDEAYRYCAALARSHYENFNVGGWITPKEKLPHVYAIYAWCRMVDDLGDEAVPCKSATSPQQAGRPDKAVTEHRLARLEWWEEELEAMYSGAPTHPISMAVQQTARVFGIPPEPFRRLIHANIMDQGSGRFETLDEVLEYCTYSANPVGHLYLHLFGYAERRLLTLSDQTCTALQLTNFWQDVSRDYHERGRVYLPQRDMGRFGVTEDDIATGNVTNAFRSLLRHECEIAMNMFRQGVPLVDELDRKARLPVALFTRGGVAVLDAIRRQRYDVLSQRPALSKQRKAWLLASAWLGGKLGTRYGLPKP